MAEFQWWLLIVGLVFGAGLTWLVLADSSRREVDVDARELASEAAWIAARLAATAGDVEAPIVESVLREHRTYLSAPPPDEPDPEAPRRMARPMARSVAPDAPINAEGHAGPEGEAGLEPGVEPDRHRPRDPELQPDRPIDAEPGRPTEPEPEPEPEPGPEPGAEPGG